MIFELFKTFFKIGAFTFGGGYAMISVVKEECVDKKKWLKSDEFVNLIALSESTPGPLAVNMATYIGYKKGNILGAIISTISVVLPSLIIIYVISIFIKDLIHIKVISDAFFGIRIAVAIIICRTAYNLIREEYKISDKKIYTIISFLIYTILLFLIEFFEINISIVVFIVIAIIISIFLTLINLKSIKK